MSSFPNRDKYMGPILMGGGVAILGSFIPVLNYLNLFAFWYILGGVAGAYQLRQKSPSATMGEQAAVAGLGGLFASVLMTLLQSIIGCILLGIALSETRDEALVLGFASTLFFVVWAIALIIFPLASALGGVIGGAIWPPTMQPGEEGEPYQPTPEELEARARKRKKVLQFVGAGCAGCAMIMIGCTAGLGYLVYLEDRSPRDSAGADAVLEMPIQAGQPVAFELPTTEGRQGIWLVAGDDSLDNYAVDGRYDCTRYGEPDISSNRYSGSSLYASTPDRDDNPRWVYLTSQYGSSYSTESCLLMITSPASLPAGSRLVVTEVIRPSDWF